MGRRGPPRTPTAQLRLAGSWRASHRQGEPTPRVQVPPAPTWLDREARAEWRRVAPQLAQLGCIAEQDRALLAQYCALWSEVIDLQRQVRRLGWSQSTESGATVATPEARLLMQARTQLRAYAAQFGLSPASRANLSHQSPTGPQTRTPEQERDARMFGA